MGSFTWTWILALFLVGGWAPAPECGSPEEVQEEEQLRHPERDSRLRKKAVPAPAPVPRIPAPAPARARLLPATPSDVALWISRSHERSPTA